MHEGQICTNRHFCMKRLFCEGLFCTKVKKNWNIKNIKKKINKKTKKKKKSYRPRVRVRGKSDCSNIIK